MTTTSSDDSGTDWVSLGLDPDRQERHGRLGGARFTVRARTFTDTQSQAVLAAAGTRPALSLGSYRNSDDRGVMLLVRWCGGR